MLTMCSSLVTSLHRWHALTLVLIERPHCHSPRTILYIVPNFFLPCQAMHHPLLVISFFVVISRMSTSALSSCQCRFTRLSRIC